MALRLIDTTADDAGSQPIVQLDTLPARARASVLTGDLDVYHRIASQTEKLTGPHRRYTAEVAIVEAGLAACDGNSLSGIARTRGLGAVAEVALTILERDPAEPILLNYAGVACYELWMLDAAQALFLAARRLDPGLAHVSMNLSEVARRRRGPRPSRPLHPAAPALARRARKVADRARPAQDLTISLCMIVKDEAAMLGQCLAAAAPAVDEMVIVDTGSTDDTIAIARSFGARVIEQPWTGSFAEARNTSFDAATGDWLLFLDADEVVADGDAPRLRELAGHTWREAMYLAETSYTGQLGDGTAFNHLSLRLFRNRPEYRFEGRIHEQIRQTLPLWAPGRVATTSVRIEHYGYLGEVRTAKEKFTRNVELLRQQQTELGDSAFLQYNLGSEYGATGDFPAAAEAFGASWRLLGEENLQTSVDYGPSVVAGLVRTLRNSQRTDESDQIAVEGLGLFGDFTDLEWERACNALERKDYAGAKRCFERCVSMGDAPAKYGGMLGVGTYRPRAAIAAIELEHGGSVSRALELLRWCVANHPRYLAVAAPFMITGLKAGVAPAALVEELEAGLDEITPAVRHAMAGSLRKAKALPEAVEQYRKLLASGSDSGLHVSAHSALAAIMLADGDFAQAAEHAAAIADDQAPAAMACRIETCSRLAVGDHAAAIAALARAEAVGLPAAEQAMFAAWIALQQTGEAPQLRVASVPVMGMLMEALLGARAVDAFDQLRTLLVASLLPGREQRELLADIQLRCGYLVGAAAEWTTICQDVPDVRALLGLAKIALVKKLPDDAASFAAAALDLDGTCAEARAILNIVGRAPNAAGTPTPAAVDG